MSTVYCTSSDMRTWLGITDTNDDAAIAIAINTSSRMIDNYTNSFFYLSDTATARPFCPDDDGDCVETPPIATTSGLVVKVDYARNGSYSTTLTLNTDYVVKPDGGYDSAGFAVPYNAIHTLLGRYLPQPLYGRPTVQITAQWGWAAVPDEIKNACIIQTARIYRRRLTPEGFASGEAFGAIRVSSRMDPDVEQMIRPFRSGSSMVV